MIGMPKQQSVLKIHEIFPGENRSRFVARNSIWIWSKPFDSDESVNESLFTALKLSCCSMMIIHCVHKNIEVWCHGNSCQFRFNNNGFKGK